MDAKTTSAAPRYKARDYKSGIKPIWCPGCGHFSVLSAVTKALAALNIAPHHIALVSGIGCSSRLPAYASTYGFHGLHGRALPIATGVKVARPELTVIAMGGDGDGFSIGGNHFLHACRRNVDLTYIVMDNQIYGMTKGQASPTTPGDRSATRLTPFGAGMEPLDPARLAMAAGASFVARGYFGDPNQVARLVAEAITHPGFAVVQVLSQCPTYAPEQAGWKQLVHPVGDSDPAEPVDDGFALGVLARHPRPTFPPPWPHVPAPGAEFRP